MALGLFKRTELYLCLSEAHKIHDHFIIYRSLNENQGHTLDNRLLTGRVLNVECGIKIVAETLYRTQRKR